MTVSNEDRDAAAELLKIHGVDVDRLSQGVFCACGVDVSALPSWRTHELDVLIAHGWGPQRTVSKKEMARLMVHAWMSTQDPGDAFDAMVEAAGGGVMAAGIEVAE